MPITQEKAPVYDLSQFSILIVEDSPYMQNLMISMLQAFGVGDIMTSDDANEAIDLLTIMQARRSSIYVTGVDIVLTDWLMTKGAGKSLLQWIRGHEKEAIKFLPTIVVSGYTTELILNEARDMGAHETLVKPVSGIGLAQRICSVIDNPRDFIDAPAYFGPDRRRQDIDYPGQDKRLIKMETIKVVNERK